MDNYKILEISYTKNKNLKNDLDGNFHKINSLSTEEYIKLINKYTNIWILKIRRLSDNEIFSINDEITFGFIFDIYLNDNNELKFKIIDYHNGLIKNSFNVYLEDLIKKNGHNNGDVYNIFNNIKDINSLGKQLKLLKDIKYDKKYLLNEDDDNIYEVDFDFNYLNECGSNLNMFYHFYMNNPDNYEILQVKTKNNYKYNYYNKGDYIYLPMISKDRLRIEEFYIYNYQIKMDVLKTEENGKINRISDVMLPSKLLFNFEEKQNNSNMTNNKIEEKEFKVNFDYDKKYGYTMYLFIDYDVNFKNEGNIKYLKECVLADDCYISNYKIKLIFYNMETQFRVIFDKNEDATTQLTRLAKSKADSVRKTLKEIEDISNKNDNLEKIQNIKV